MSGRPCEYASSPAGEHFIDRARPPGPKQPNKQNPQRVHLPGLCEVQMSERDTRPRHPAGRTRQAGHPIEHARARQPIPRKEPGDCQEERKRCDYGDLLHHNGMNPTTEARRKAFYKESRKPRRDLRSEIAEQEYLLSSCIPGFLIEFSLCPLCLGGLRSLIIRPVNRCNHHTHQFF